MNVQTTDYQFNSRLKKIRSEMGVSQEKLAQILNISRNTIAAYEVGTTEPTLSTLAKISELNPNLSVRWLLAGDGNMYLTDADGESAPKLPEPGGQVEVPLLPRDLELMAALKDLNKSLQHQVDLLKAENERLKNA